MTNIYFALISLIFGTCIIIARAYAVKESKLFFYIYVGIFEGLPLIISAVLFILNVRWAILFFIFSFFGSYCLGTLLKWNLEKRFRRQRQNEWNEWQEKITKTSIWKRVLFLL